MDLNNRCFSGYRRYSNAVPVYLHDRPRPFVLHCMDRLHSAADTLSSHIIQSSSQAGVFSVRSQTEKAVTYEVCMGEHAETLPQCSCYDFQKTKWPCKHFFSVFEHFPQWCFSKLPMTYIGNPFITLDTHVLPGAESRKDERLQDENSTCQETKPRAPEFETLQSSHEGGEEQVAEAVADIKKHVKNVNKHNGPANSVLLEEQTSCRERLQLIKDKTYLVQDTTVLSRVRGLLDDIISELRKAMVTEKGIPLQQASQLPKKVPQRSQYLSLKKRKGKKKFSGRSGLKASIMRKTYQVNVPVTSSQSPERGQNAKKRKSAKISCSYGCGSHSVPVEDKESPSVAETEDQPDVSLANQFNEKDHAHTKGIAEKVPDPDDDMGHLVRGQSTAATLTEKRPAPHISSKPSLVQKSPYKVNRCRSSQKENIEPVLSNDTSDTNPDVAPPIKRRCPDPLMDNSNLTGKEAIQSSQSFQEEQQLPLGVHSYSPIKVVQESSEPPPERRSNPVAKPGLKRSRPNPVSQPPPQKKRLNPLMDTSNLTHEEAGRFSPAFKLEQSIKFGRQTCSPIKVVQGSMSQQSAEFSETNKGKQCTSNSLTFLLHHATFPEEKVSQFSIDAVLKVGDRVHTTLTSALGDPGERLSLEELQAAIRIIGESQCLTFPDGILTGDIFSKASSLPFVTLEEGLHSALQTNAGSLLRILEYTVAVKKLTDDCIAVFDPHARNNKGFVDGNGNATTMMFVSPDAVAEYIRKFVRHKGCEERAPVLEDDIGLAERGFEMLPICCDKGEDSILSRILKVRDKTNKNNER